MNNFSMKFRDFTAKLNARFARFMQGRYGMDELAKAQSVFIWIILILSLVFSWVPYLSFVLSILFWAAIIYMYFRVFSKNISKRYTENQKYLYYRSKFFNKRERMKKEHAQKGAYRFFSCPGCKQRVRIPKGRGKICITCPKCRMEFVKRT
jgi:hypothetical protein